MNQLYIFLCFFLTGVIIGILFDIFRILRKSFKTWDIITYIQDFIFWILTGIILLYSIFTFNNGELRAFVFVGILLGITLYILLISKYFVKTSVKIVSIIKEILYFPINKIYNFTKKYIFKPVSTAISKTRLKFNIKLPKLNLKKQENDNLSNKIQ